MQYLHNDISAAWFCFMTAEVEMLDAQQLISSRYSLEGKRYVRGRICHVLLVTAPP